MAARDDATHRDEQAALPGSPPTTRDLELLSKFWLTPEIVEVVSIRRVDDSEAREILGSNAKGGNCAGLAFPYRWPGQDGLGFHVRLDRPDLEEDEQGELKERGKYLAQRRLRGRLYIPPGVSTDMLSDTGLSVVLTVGETGALALWRLARHEQEESEAPRFLSVGLQHPWGWRGKTGFAYDRSFKSRRVMGPVEDLGLIEWTDRRAVVVYDSSASADSQVDRGRKGLAQELRKRGAEVFLVDLPNAKSVYGIGHLLCLWGAQRVLELLQKARPAQTETERSKEILVQLGDSVKADSAGTLRRALATETLGTLALVRANDRGGFEQWLLDLRAAGIKAKDVETLHKAVKDQKVRRLQVVPAGEKLEPATAGNTLENAPFPDLLIPPPYFLNTTATGYIETNDEGESTEVTIAYAPILVILRLRDAEEGIEYLRLAYRRPDGWRELTVDRGVAMDVRKLIEQASVGFPVSTKNAGEIVKYLHELEAANFERLPCARVTSHLGWQGNLGDGGFLCGQRFVAADGLATDESSISFRGAAPGDEQIATAYHSAGSLDEWLRAIRRIQAYPRVLLPVYASFVPPLLMVLKANNFIVDLACRTSTGKTITLRVAASVWGRPDERAPDGAIGSWDSTGVYLERASSVLSGLPVILDDTKRAKAPKMVSDMLYLAANGRGRARGNVKSLARTKSWRTVLLSSGEAPATSFTQDGGTRTRCLEVRGLPFGSADEATRQLVIELNERVQANYGHAGLGFVRHVLSHRSDWDRLREDYQKTVARYANSAPTPEGGRLAEYMAAIEVAAELVREVFDLPWDYREPLRSLWPDIAAQAADAAGAERALQDVASWAYANQQRFSGRLFDAMPGHPPTGGWVGRWDVGDDWSFVAFLSTVVKKVLRDQGYEPEPILAEWRERGWLIVDLDRSRFTTKRFALDGDKLHMIAVRREAIEEVAK